MTLRTRETLTWNRLIWRSQTRWIRATNGHESTRRNKEIVSLQNATIRSWCLCTKWWWSVGCVCVCVEFDIWLKDNIACIGELYRHSKLFYGEVKEYLDYLIYWNWICKSSPAYSSRMVCLHKNDGSLRLGIAKQELNRKTYPKPWLIPQIQNILHPSRESLPPGFHGRRKLPPHCICNTLGIVTIEYHLG